ncbi:MAG: electron transport complex subunit RsxC, partial [Eubacteriales bacterium]|nr:electron transport complex subunit RsxC [Eubacteriales bacterium]
FRPFRGGTEPLKKTHHGKLLTQDASPCRIPASERMIYPLSQHIGAPAQPVVAKGDEVRVGQMIAAAGSFVSANLYASVSGVVEDIGNYPNGAGLPAPAIVIRNDFQDKIADDIVPYPPIGDMTADELLRVVRNAGLTGMGGASFPTQVKLTIPPEKKVDTLIINAAECEPYLTADDWLMKTAPQDIADGIRAVKKILGVSSCVVAVEANKRDAAAKVTAVLRPDDGVTVRFFPVRYPQGAEKQLIYAVTRREVPSGGLPADVGAVVMNIATAGTFGRTLRTGMPYIERIVTVTGEGVREPKNLIVRLGASFADLIAFCGGLSDDTVRLLAGGPMMGLTLPGPEGTVVKGTGGLVALTEHETAAFAETPCIHCGRCVAACPMGLLPLKIDAAVRLNNTENCERFHASDCIECGACTYVCPAKRHLTHACRVAKQMLRKKKEEGRG